MTMKYFILLLALTGAGILSRAQGNTDGGLDVRYPGPLTAQWSGDSLTVSFRCLVDGQGKGAVSLHLVPVYISGGDTVRYPGMAFLSPAGARFLKRREALTGTSAGGEVRILRRNGRAMAEYRQSRLVPGATNGRLQILQVLRTCCHDLLTAGDALEIPAPDPGPRLPATAGAVNVPLFEANVTFIEPKAETVKERTTVASVRITYPLNHWKVCPEFGDNRRDLAEVHRILSPIAADTGSYSLVSVYIAGYASPEDSYRHNLALSEKRARGMRDYLQNRYGIPARKITTQGMGEDWDGLRRDVRNSSLPWKRQAVDIIDRYDVFHGREKALMDLDGGIPYRYMLKHLFPRLRRMEMRIVYRVRPFAAHEAGVLFDSRPQDLSLHEMYRVARAGNNDRTIIRERNQYGWQYDVAVRYFPHDDIANINASSAALVRGDLEAARMYLDRVAGNPLADNNLGVYYWLCGNTARAKAYFLKARLSDPVRADHNLGQLLKWERDSAPGTNPKR